MSTASDFIVENGTLKEYRGPGGDVVIPDGVTIIGKEAFYWCSNLTSVVIPEGVTSIGEEAFSRCRKLSSVVIPEGVTSIGEEAFSWCESLTSVIIPEGVTSIGGGTVRGCESLMSVIIPEGVTSIGEGAFSWCENLTSVIIPEGVTSIGKEAFSGCKSLTSVIIPESVTSIGEGAFSWCENLTSVIIPEGVTSIGEEAFSRCRKLSSVVIPESVTSIGEGAFSGCKSLTSVIIPEGVTSIGKEAFSRCENLTSVVIPESVTSIGAAAFLGCEGIANAEGFVILHGILYDYIGKRVTITIPEGVTSIGQEAFRGCNNLTSVDIPEGVTSIGEGAFSWCENLTSVIIPEGVTSIGGGTFRGCESLTSVIIPEGVTSIGEEAFSWCENLTSVIIPEGVTSIGKEAFSWCENLTSVIIPEGVTSIGQEAFSGCKSLTSVIIPESVTSIGEGAFFDSGLTGVVIPEGVKSIGDNAFGACGKLQLISAGITPSWETAPGCSFGLRLIQDKVRFLAFSSKSDRDNLTDYAETGKWTTYDLELLNNGPEYRYRLPARLLGMIGRLMDPVELTDENKALMIEFLTKNAKKLLTLAEGLEEPAVVSAMFENGIINSGNQKALLKLISASENPEIAALASAGVQAAPVKKPAPRTTEAEDNQWTKLFKGAGGEKEFRDMKLIGAALPTVKMKTGENAPEDLLKFILISYGRQLKTGIRIDPDADAAAEELSYESLCDALDTLSDHLDGPHYPAMLPVLCRYGNVTQIRELLKIQKQWSNYSQYGIKGRRAQEQLVRSLALSDTHEAVIWLNKNSTLFEYARLRGISEAQVYEKHLFDFGFDESGKKYYDLGTTTVEVSISKELKLSLYDTAKRKVIRGLPQKGTDPDLRKKAADDLSDLRSNLKKAVSVKTDQLLSDWLQARTVQAEQWRNSYLKNPVLRAVGSLLVWTQGKTGFTLTETGTVTADGSPYPLGEAPVLLAHPMEMAPEETEQWQHYFAGNKLKQPFEQIWEPAYDAKEIQEDRYTGAAVRFKYLKNRVKHGIDAGIYYTYEDVTDYINLKSCKIDYEIKEYATGAYFEDNRALLETKAILGKFSCKEFNRQVNHIVYLLDKLTVYERIAKDDASVCIFLPKYSLPQIMEFIQIANENQATNVQAMLMKYKDEHFSEFDPMDEFTLDLV